MKKSKIKLLGWAIGMAMAVGTGAALVGGKRATPVHATNSTVTWTASAASDLYGSYDNGKISSVNGTSIGTISTGTFSWNFTRTLVNLASKKNDNISFQGSTWIQLGSNNALESITFSTSAIPGTIKYVSVTAATAGTHVLNVSVGGTKYLTDEALTTYTSTATATNPDPSDCGEQNTVEGTSEGEIIISLASAATTTNKAVLIKSISVTYEEAATGTLDSISLSGTYPTSFTVGDSFSHEGMTVTANYINPTSSSDVTSSATFTGYNMGEAGEQTVTVSYGGKSITYGITVSAPVAVTGVSLNKASTTIAKGSTETLTATVSPNNASNKNVTWESDDESVATVSGGVVTGVAAGTATITAKSAADPTKTATCEVTVTAPLYEGSLAVCNWSAFTKGTAAADKSLTDATSVSGKTLTWNISSGEYFGNSAPYTYVLGDYNTNNGAYATFSALDNYAGIVAGLEQNSLTSYNKIYALYTRNFGVIDLNKATFSWALAKNAVTTARIMASNDGGVHWSLLASQDVTAEESGSVSWTGSTYSDGKTVEVALVITSNSTAGATTSAPQLRGISWILNGASFNESPTWKPAKITVTSDSSNVEVGQNLTLSATKAPSFASDSTITWSSSATEKATVNPSTGVVHGESVGGATITATTAEGVTGTKPVSVIAATVPVSSVELDESALNIKQAGSATLTATVSPVEATDKTVVWSIAGDSDITVNQNGKVTVAKTATVGDTATVTVTTNDGSKTATCSITVTAFEADYNLLTNVNELYDGMRIVIGDIGGDYAAGSLNASKYLNRVSATVVNGGLVSDDAQEFTLRGKVNAWQFENSEGEMLGLTSGSNNNVALTENGSGSAYKWTITYSNGAFVVKNNSYTTSYLQYNSGNSGRFSNYGNTMANVAFYAADSDDNILTFVRANMRMGDTALASETDTGKCKSDGNDYYITAKTALSLLTASERSDFENDTGSKYTEALKRYKAWASACGDKAPFDGTTVISLSAGVISALRSGSDSARTPLLVAAFAGVGALAVGGMVFLRKRKEL